MSSKKKKRTAAFLLREKKRKAKKESDRIDAELMKSNNIEDFAKGMGIKLKPSQMEIWPYRL